MLLLLQARGERGRPQSWDLALEVGTVTVTAGAVAACCLKVKRNLGRTKSCRCSKK